MWSSDDYDDWELGREVTTTDDGSFEMTFDSEELMTYVWACQGTSLNPDPTMALYMTDYTTGSTDTECVDCESDGAASIFSTLIAASLVVFAIFFY